MRGKSNPRLPRLAAGLTLGAIALASAVCTPAQAADGPPIPDLQGAVNVLHSDAVHDTVCRFLTANTKSGSSGKKIGPSKAVTCDPQQQFTLGVPIALYEITPDFVTGKAAPTLLSAVQLSYLVAKVTGSNGHNATVLLAAASSAGNWHMAAVRDGDADVTYAAKATVGSMVFSEPQIHAWYKLTLNTVTPLNDAATMGLGGKSSVSLADYQKLVKGRFSDKMPGSDYDTKGFSSGYGLTAPDRSSPAPLVLGSSGAAAALAGGMFALRAYRRRRG
ncbi:hypothetical protein VR41_09070 [Streptomyces sp. NRRL B-1568]|nr:hypothetical protein VR41_09070 [Streptomyces sp. NRRL B-1568]